VRWLSWIGSTPPEPLPFSISLSTVGRTSGREEAISGNLSGPGLWNLREALRKWDAPRGASLVSSPRNFCTGRNKSLRELVFPQ